MKHSVTLLKGTYRGSELTDIQCQLIGDIKYGARGLFGNFEIPGKGPIRVQLPSEDAIIRHELRITSGLHEEETEESIIDRIKERFNIFKLSIDGIAQGDVRALIVAGAPGIGKTETIQRTLEEHKQHKGIEFEIVRGNIVSSYQLYQLLFLHQKEDDVLVLDDCDAILKDSNALNILKAALESGDRPRIISYKSQSVLNMGIPNEFEYKGRMIFVTNENFQKIIDKDNSTIAKHMKAIIDRTLYLDLQLYSRREVYCRIKQMIKEDSLLYDYVVNESYYDQILLWIKDNLDDIRSLSLRTPVHVAEMIRTNEKSWHRMASAFLLRNGK